MAPDEVTGVILCGGRGRRVAGRDKGLMPLGGRPLVTHVAGRFAPQVKHLLVSLNRNRRRYEALGFATVPDRWSGYRGPLAGVASAMGRVVTPYLAVVPCDDPFLPADLVERLWRGLHRAGAEVCVAHCGDRLYPLHAVMKARVRRALEAYVGAGGAGVQQWLATQRWTAVEVAPRASPANLNTAMELRACANKVRTAAGVPRIGANESRRRARARLSPPT